MRNPFGIAWAPSRLQRPKAICCCIGSDAECECLAFHLDLIGFLNYDLKPVVFFSPSFSSLFFLGLVGIKPCRFLKGILCIGGHHPILACLVLLSNLCSKGLVHAFGRVALTLEWAKLNVRICANTNRSNHSNHSYVWGTSCQLPAGNISSWDKSRLRILFVSVRHRAISNLSTASKFLFKFPGWVVLKVERSPSSSFGSPSLAKFQQCFPRVPFSCFKSALY